MKLKLRKKTPPQETIVSLIDVVFFLLVFFMMVGRMDATSPFAVTPPLSFAGADMPSGGVTVSIGFGGKLALDGTEMSEPDMLEQIARQVARNGDLLLRINADGQSRLQNLLPLVSKIEALGVRDVVLVVTPNLQ